MYTRDDGTLLKNALNFIQILIEEVKIGSLRNFLGFKENDISGPMIVKFEFCRWTVFSPSTCMGENGLLSEASRPILSPDFERKTYRQQS